MKKLIGSLFVISIVLFSSCEGVQGPPGVDGETLLGKVFEITGDFKTQNNFELYFEFPTSFEIYDGDIVMVYLLWEQVNEGTVDVWRPLPQTIVLNNGVLQYNFDYTLMDVKIFLDGTVDFNTLLPAEKDNQTFRIAVFPAEFAEDKSFNINNLKSMMNKLDITESSIRKVDF
jgi:hypothetical protein